MNTPSLPSGYDVTKLVHAGRADCQLTVGFDRQQAHIPRFLVQLHYQVAADPVRWGAIARMDHNETSTMGHDIYREGLHVDVARQTKRTVHLQIRHNPLPHSRGMVIRRCVEYLRSEADYFIDVYEERRFPGGPPRFQPDGGEPTRKFICLNPLEPGMSREPAADEPISPEELSELLAEVEGTTHEAIERGAEELKIGPPEEAKVVDTE